MARYRYAYKYPNRKNGIRIAAIILLIVSILMYLGWLEIPVINIYSFWLAVIAFGVLLMGSKNG
jgi:hypothetical protein